MRSRYTAHVTGDDAHLWRTWHPRTRPESIQASPGLVWTGLEIFDVVAGGREDQEGVVSFRAAFTADGQPGIHVEQSQFARRGTRWMYLDGHVDAG